MLRVCSLALLIAFTALALACGVPEKSDKNKGDGEKGGELSKAENGSNPKLGPELESQPPRPPRNLKDPFEAIVEEVRQNPDAAVKRHKGETVTVKGTVFSAEWVDKKSAGPHAVVMPANEKSTVAAMFGRGQVDKVLALKKGQSVEIVGRLFNAFRDQEGNVTVIVDGCELVQTSTGSVTPPVKTTTPPSETVAPKRPTGNAPPKGFASEWVQLGKIRTRVVGAAIAQPVLVDLKGKEATSPDSAFLVWVETQAVSTGAIELRRWIGSFDSAATLKAGVAELKPVRFAGAVAAGQIERAVKLNPADQPTVDVLAFQVPEDGTKDLVIRLAGSHVNEQGVFEHTIPASAWKK